VIHEAVSGNFKNQAVLSFLFEDVPGKINEAVNEWNIINLPNPKVPEVNEFFSDNFHVLKFIYNEQELSEEPYFNHYKYMGSLTSPPCEENIVWFIHAAPIPIGSTAIEMIRNALNEPGTSPLDRKDNYDGSNR
jgi:carbonic anhydrase